MFHARKRDRMSNPLDYTSEALNWTSGETVAIKQISIENIPVGELSDIMVRTWTIDSWESGC